MAFKFIRKKKQNTLKKYRHKTLAHFVQTINIEQFKMMSPTTAHTIFKSTYIYWVNYLKEIDSLWKKFFNKLIIL